MCLIIIFIVILLIIIFLFIRVKLKVFLFLCLIFVREVIFILVLKDNFVLKFFKYIYMYKLNISFLIWS